MPYPENRSTETADALSAQGVRAGATNIALSLRRAIVEGRYSDGQQLPAERQLASQFGASRSTVRAALRRLEEGGLVVRRAGSGTFVSFREQADGADIAESTSPLELIEVRFAVEPHMLRLAVMHASARDLEKLAGALTEAESTDGDPEAFSRADERFHLCLAECTHNPLLKWLYAQINDVRGHNQWSARKDKILTRQRIREYNRQHRELFRAVVSRDMESAVKIISKHLEKARHDLVGLN